MRLFKRGKYWYVELRRGEKRSTKETDRDRAAIIFRELKREYLRGRLIKLDEAKRVTLSKFTEAYIERSYSSRETERADSLALRLLADVVGANTPLFAITSKRLDEFKATCIKRGCRPTSVNTYLRHIKAALGAAEGMYKGYRRPKLKLLKTGKRLPRILTPEQIKTLLNAARKKDRDFYPAMMVYVWTGIRRSELLTLTWQDIDLARGTARVTGKGDEERVIPLLPKLLRLLKARRRDLGPVFPRWHRDTITHRFRKLARSCGISCRLHDLRHSAATYMLASGTPLPVVQAVLGHASVTTTQIYAKTLAEVVKKETRLKYE